MSNPSGDATATPQPAADAETAPPSTSNDASSSQQQQPQQQQRAAQPMSCTIVKTDTESDSRGVYTLYVIELKENDRTWEVRKRYREFHSLNSKFIKKKGIKIPLPPKVLIGNMKEANIHKRRISLQMFLTSILSNEALYDSAEIREFLEINSNVPRDHKRRTLARDTIIDTVVAVFNYTKTGPEELSFEQGEIVAVVKKDDSGWWYGYSKGSAGFFPSNHVTSVKGIDLDSLRRSARPRSTVLQSGVLSEPALTRKAIALFDFKASEDGETDLKAGEHVVVKDSDAEWCLVVNVMSLKQGWVPTSYIRLLDELGKDIKPDLPQPREKPASSKS